MHPAILVGIGVVAGAIGTKAASSQAARKVCVKGLVQGMKAKEQCETLVEDAKAEFDDLMAEAEYEAKGAEADEEEAEVVEEEPVPAKPAKKAAAKRPRKAAAKAAEAAAAEE